MNTKEKGFTLSLLTFLALKNIYLPFIASECNAKNPVVFTFGDSNSDTGGFTAGLGVEFGYPYGRIFAGGATGRASDGRLVIDFLCEYLDTKYLSPYLNSIQPNFKNGVNFAIIGAATLPKHVAFNLDTQIRQFKHFHNRSIELHSRGLTTLVGDEDFKSALYTIDIGQNDLSGSLGSLSFAQVTEKIPSFVSEIKYAMWAIYQLGGRNFWVHNTGPLGCLPRELAIRNNTNSTDFDEYGCLKTLNEGAKLFNNKLNTLCAELRFQMENSTIVYVDVYSIKYDLVANSTSYGFNNPLVACCGYGGPPYNFNSEKMCSDKEHTECEEESPHINWDGTHYTEAANAIVVSKILSTHYSFPPLKFNFFCNSDRIVRIYT